MSEIINEKALLLIDDVIIDINTYCVFDEYKDDVREWCKKWS